MMTVQRRKSVPKTKNLPVEPSSDEGMEDNASESGSSSMLDHVLDSRDNAYDFRLFTARHTLRLAGGLCFLILVSYVIGKLGMTWPFPVLLCVLALVSWRSKVSEISDFAFREAEILEHRRRAFEHAETVEWLNFLLNRWWVFSDRSLFQLIKNSIDPVLESCKPTYIESIEVTDFTLGTRTPYFKYARVYDTTQDMQKLMANEITFRYPPIDLVERPKYQVVLDMDMGLESPDSKFILRVRLSKKLGHTDIVVETLQIRGRVQLILYFNQNVPFPHLAAFSLSFLHVPKYSFQIRLLKKVQLMEFPVIREWILQIIEDSLKLTMVDPGHITIPLCNDPDLLGRRAGYAEGVLTITIMGGFKERTNADAQWCSLTLGKQKARTKEVHNDVTWQEHISLIVWSMPYDKLIVRIKGKRRFGTNYTIVEYVLPLVRMNLKQEPTQDIELEDPHVSGSLLQLHLEYNDLPLLNVSNEIKEEEFKTNYLDKVDVDPPSVVSGVLFVRVHKGTNLIPMDPDGLSDPYCMIFANKDLIHLSHVIEDTLNPEWDSMVEFLTADYRNVALSFILNDRNPVILPTMMLSNDNDDFMGSCNFSITESDHITFKKELDVLFKVHSRSGKDQAVLKKAGKICISVIFRPIATVAKCLKPGEKKTHNEGEPLHQKHAKMDNVTMEALLCAERGSLTIGIVRARNLAAMDMNGKSDPFVIVRLGQSKIEKYRTKIIYRTLNPVWNEEVTFALPESHERVTVEVWDKDPFTQERLGNVTFDYEELVKLTEGQEDWHKLQGIQSGELLLNLKVEMPKENCHACCEKSEEEENPVVRSGSYSFSMASEDYVMLDVTDDSELTRSSDASTVKDGSHSPSLSRNRKQKSTSTPASPVFKDENAVDLSHDPFRFFGVYGEILELSGLTVPEGATGLQIRLRLDKYETGKQRRASFFGQGVLLCKSEMLPIADTIIAHQHFKTKPDQGFSPVTFLNIEVKDDKREVVDSKSILLRNFLQGEAVATRKLNLDNGGELHMRLGHLSSESNSLRKRRSRISR